MWSLHKSYKNRPLNGRKLMNEIQTKSVGTAKKCAAGHFRAKRQRNATTDIDRPKKRSRKQLQRQRRPERATATKKNTERRQNAKADPHPKTARTEKCEIHPQGRGTDKAHPKSSDPTSSASSLPSPTMQDPLSGSCAFRASTHPPFKPFTFANYNLHSVTKSPIRVAFLLQSSYRSHNQTTHKKTAFYMPGSCCRKSPKEAHTTHAER